MLNVFLLFSLLLGANLNHVKKKIPLNLSPELKAILINKIELMKIEKEELCKNKENFKLKIQEIKSARILHNAEGTQFEPRAIEQEEIPLLNIYLEKIKEIEGSVENLEANMLAYENMI